MKVNSCALASHWEASIAVLKAAARWLAVVPDAVSGALMACFFMSSKALIPPLRPAGRCFPFHFTAQVLGRSSGSTAWRSSLPRRSIG